MDISENLVIDDIKSGLPGLTPVTGAFLKELCIVCLHRSNHKLNLNLSVLGDKNCKYNILWNDEYTEQMDKTHRDQEYATEHGAICISILVALKQTKYTIVERSRKTTGFDYWLGEKNTLPFRCARLEVSGIFKGKQNIVETRFKRKARQTNVSDFLTLPAYVSIVEFSNPLCIFAEKK